MFLPHAAGKKLNLHVKASPRYEDYFTMSLNADYHEGLSISAFISLCQFLPVLPIHQNVLAFGTSLFCFNDSENLSCRGIRKFL